MICIGPVNRCTTPRVDGQPSLAGGGKRRLFGRQIWDYSIEGSLPTLNALLTYLDEQKLSKRRMSVNELFVPNIKPGLADYLRATGEA
jgi:hypothetical protein